MPAFALPSYYDGKVRINLQGRERDGIVPLSEYDATCEAIEALLRQCIDPRTGESVVGLIERPGRDPMGLGGTEADIDVFWRGAANVLHHPRLGRLGPLPFRRPGGHTGETGVAYFAGEGIPLGRHGTRSAFDVVPTLFEMLGEAQPPHLTGESFLPMLLAGSPSTVAG
jgi:predicted AlkP superfamily phosphohydrolase/phosphomutase